MASGINNIHQPGTCNGSKAARSSSAEECNREMHVKMCKKIAQLTKVIYALNTKNDEHEDSIEALREAHEEEIRNILAETRETILQCKSKAEEEQLLRKHIQALEIAVAQHKRLKEEALAELILCKKQAEEKESRTEEKQAQTGLSTDTVDTTADFENKLPHLNQELDGLLNECKVFRGENLDKKVNLDEKCSVERHIVMNEIQNLKSENQKTYEEYTQQTRKLQAPCEIQKETLKIAMQQSVIEANCEQGETEQKKSSEAEEGFLLQQVKKLEADLEEKSQKINERKKHSQKLKERIQELQTQLDEFKRKSECELKQLEKEKEVLTGKLQNSSLEVAQLKQILEQQANNFKESLKKHNLQSNKEKEKLLQDLQNTIKENQNVKLQLEASHQKVLKMLEKSKNQELKEAEERLKKEFNETLKIQHQSHRLEIQTLEEKAKKELHDELEQIQKQQTLLLGSLRMELSEQQTSCTNLKKQIEELQMELRSVRTLKKQQEGSSQSQIRSLHDELEKCQSEISELKRENLLLKDTMELLSAELESQKQEAAQLQDRDKQHRRFALNSHLTVLSRDSIIMPESEWCSSTTISIWEGSINGNYVRRNPSNKWRLLVEDLNIKHKKELDVLKGDHRKEIENIVSDFSSTQAHLQAKIFSLETALKELEEKSRKWESRPEDTHLINCLQDKLSEREEIIKQLVLPTDARFHTHDSVSLQEGRKCQHSFSANTESYRNRSFSFNPNTACLTPSMKKKKIEVPSRVVSVPNLASYAKSFLSCDLRSKRSAPQITKSTSLDRSSGCLRVGSPSTQSSDSSAATRTHGNEPPQTKDDQKQDPQHQEWFTKYFSF
ncbi:protein FAM184B isoform X2 [Pyrgilauda ruficollis]|uniref:protein FAM184B isoform X2 n=1 Tax=Pyrgilauda ruficollis TaxID=221976 RepID=UPI001B87BE8F|nr:protein FAM184B isoform X2 [Pyrgilauda ruficollis]